VVLNANTPSPANSCWESFKNTIIEIIYYGNSADFLFLLPIFFLNERDICQAELSFLVLPRRLWNKGNQMRKTKATKVHQTIRGRSTFSFHCQAATATTMRVICKLRAGCQVGLLQTSCQGGPFLMNKAVTTTAFIPTWTGGTCSRLSFWPTYPYLLGQACAYTCSYERDRAYGESLEFFDNWSNLKGLRIDVITVQ